MLTLLVKLMRAGEKVAWGLIDFIDLVLGSEYLESGQGKPGPEKHADLLNAASASTHEELLAFWFAHGNSMVMVVSAMTVSLHSRSWHVMVTVSSLCPCRMVLPGPVSEPLALHTHTLHLTHSWHFCVRGPQDEQLFNNVSMIELSSACGESCRTDMGQKLLNMNFAVMAGLDRLL